MLNGWHVWWQYAGMKELGHIQLPLATWGRLLADMTPSARYSWNRDSSVKNTLVQHVNMRWWHNNGLQDFVTVSLWIQIDNYKMQLCSLSVAYAITPPPPWGRLLADMTPSARYSWNRDSSVKNTLVQHVSGHWRWASAHWSRLWRRTAVRSRPWWGQRARKWASLRQFVQILLGCANPRFRQLTGWLVSDHPAGEEVRCGGLGLAWLHVVCGCEAS